MSETDYIVVGRQPWNRVHFTEQLSQLPGRRHCMTTYACWTHRAIPTPTSMWEISALSLHRVKSKATG